MLSARILAVLALAALAPIAQTQAPIKIDLNPKASPLGSAPQGLSTPGMLGELPQTFQLAGRHFFTASTKATGRELWSTDGTALGTQLLVDLNPGPDSGTIGYDAAVMGGRLYFVGSDGTTYMDIWSTDGTAAGTTQLKSFAPGQGWATPRALTQAGGRLYFIDGYGSSSKLWTSDGTSAGTFQLLPNGAGTTYSFFGVPFPAPDGVGFLFSVLDSKIGAALWYTDGSAAGTAMVADLNPTFDFYGFGAPVALGNQLIFSTASPLGSELYITDGTTSGTLLLSDIEPGPDSSAPYLYPIGAPGGLYYFSAKTAATGRELYQTDGTPAGTVLVTDARPGPEGSNPKPLGFAGGKLVVAADLRGGGANLYVLDQGHLSALKAPRPDAPASTYFYAFPLGDGLLVSDSGMEGFFFTNGTPAGTNWIPPGITGIQPTLLGELDPGRGIFAGGTTSTGKELMRTDGTAGGTQLLADIEQASSLHGSKLAALESPNADDLFGIVTGIPGQNLLGIHKRGVPQDLFGSSDFLAAQGSPTQVWLGDHDELLVSALDPAAAPFQSILTTTDGTQRGTAPLVPVPNATWALSILGSDGRSALLYGSHATLGVELWISDGTAAGTKVLGDLLPPAPLSAAPSRVVRLGAISYLSMPDSSTTQALWRTDYSLAGSSIVIGGLAGDKDAGLMPLVVADKIYFVGDDGVHGSELWVTDGTPAGTHMVLDILPGPSGSAIEDLFEFQGQVHFFAKGNPKGARRLWRSDGTGVGTIKVSTVKIAKGGEAVVAGEFVYFKGTAALWAYDGQTTFALASQGPGTEVHDPTSLTPVGERIYLAGASDLYGREVYVADATAGSVTLAFDLRPGPANSSPSLLTLCSGQLFFRAKGADLDDELYAFDTDLAYMVPLGEDWANIHLTSTPPKIGAAVTMTVENPPIGGVSMLVMSAPIDPLGNFVAPGNTLWVDPTSFTILGANITPGWSVTHAIPNHAGLIGSEFNLQAWFMPPSPSLGVTSNGVRLVLGM